MLKADYVYSQKKLSIWNTIGIYLNLSVTEIHIRYDTTFLLLKFSIYTVWPWKHHNKCVMKAQLHNGTVFLQYQNFVYSWNTSLFNEQDCFCTCQKVDVEGPLSVSYWAWCISHNCWNHSRKQTAKAWTRGVRKPLVKCLSLKFGSGFNSQIHRFGAAAQMA